MRKNIANPQWNLLLNKKMFYYSATEKEVLKIRNEIFLQDAVLILQEKGFEKSPFKTTCFGRLDSLAYIYEMCRLRDGRFLNLITVNICRKDKYIKIFINSFEIFPKITSLSQLSGLDGLKYHIPPNSKKEMRIDTDFIEGPPILSKSFWFEQLELGNYFTKKGYCKQVEKLRKAVISKVRNIDLFFQKWSKLHFPNVVKYDGELLNEKD